MSTMRFLELNSAYRDRNLYPLPTVFDVNISQSGQKDKLTALDPVSNASPVLVWNSTMREGDNKNDLYIDDIVLSYSGMTNSVLAGNTTFEIYTPQNLRQVRNFYVGCYIGRGALGNWPFSGYGITARRIVDYQPLNEHFAIITLECPLPDSAVGTINWVIYQPNPTQTQLADSIIKFYIPGSNSGFEDVQRFQQYGLGSDNYYVNYRVINTDTQLSLKILNFDATTRLATLDGRTYNPRTGFTENWALNPYNFTIRKEDPIEFGYILYAYNNVLQLISEVSGFNTSIQSDRYNGDFLRIRPSVGSTPPWVRPVNEERKICRFIYGAGGFDDVYGVPATGVCLDKNAVITQDYYKNCILTLTTIVGPNIIYGASTRILYYGKKPDNTCDRYAEFETPIVILPSQTWAIRSIFLCDPFTITPNINQLYEVEQFTRDNAVSFNWTGSLLTTSETVCYEIELVNLIIPNITLASGRGGRAVFYPYLYVELQQISATSGPSGTKGILSSNNPNAFRMLFRAILSDTPQPIFSPYIKIDGDLMTHTIKFKPTDNFKFGVYHANGEPLKTTLDEQYSPTESNALTQISALFSFRRVS